MKTLKDLDTLENQPLTSPMIPEKVYPKVNWNELKDLTKLRFDEIEKETNKYLENQWKDYINFDNITHSYNIAFMAVTWFNIVYFNYLDNRSKWQLEIIIREDDYFFDWEENYSEDYKVRKEYAWVLYNLVAR